MQTNKIQLSVITPVVNGRRFIEFCIKNVIKQDCLETEHTILEGGSTDGTVEISWYKEIANSSLHGEKMR